MAYPFTYTRPSDRVTGISWTLDIGTARTDYGTANLADGDPSTPLWIESTSLALVGDMGSATLVSAIDIYAHTFDSTCDLRVQMHTSSSWGSPDATITPTLVAAHEDGFTYHIRADFAAVYAAGGRTKRYFRIANLAANGVSVAIGEVCVWSQVRTLSRGVKYGFAQSRRRLTSAQASKRGVSTVYDFGSIERTLTVDVPASDTDQDDLRSLEASARGDARPFSVVLAAGASKSRFAEPLYVRLGESVTGTPYGHPTVTPVRLVLPEMGCGELVGA